MLVPASKRRIAAVDPRIEAYAKLLVERSLDVQPGWQVWINSSPLGRPLVEEVVRLIARRGAYPLVRLGGAGMEDVPFETIWALEAPEDALAEVAPADRHAWETMDAWMNIGAPKNRGCRWPSSRTSSTERVCSIGMPRAGGWRRSRSGSIALRRSGSSAPALT